MRVLSLNAWGAYGPPERRPVLRQALLDLDADLLLLQEANVPELLPALPHPFRFHFPETGLAISSRHAAGQERRHTYKTVSPLESHPRGVLFTKISGLGFDLWAGTTHLAWKTDDHATRRAQVEELLELISGLEGAVLIGGDFNTVEEDFAIRRMVSAGFTDLQAGTGCITWDNRNPFIQSHSVRFPDRRIDYLFLKDPRSTVRDCRIACDRPNAAGLFPSDHYGVLADLIQR